ncbi:MAG: hypothetical protein ACRD88_01810, partial [Terriglobia bacterium]
MDRTTRHALKTDKFALEVEHTVEYVAGHRRQVAYYTAGAVVLAAALGGFWYWRSGAAAERQQALARALDVSEATVGTPHPEGGSRLNYATEAEKQAEEMKRFNDVVARYSGSTE